MLKGACAASLRYIRPFRAASWGACPRTEKGRNHGSAQGRRPAAQADVLGGACTMTGFKPVDHRHDDALSRVSWDAFERLVADHYRGLGYEVVHVGTGGGANRTDGG